MQLTDDEIRAIIIQERKRKKKKQKIKRRITMIILFILILILGIGIFINRSASIRDRGIIFIDPGHGGVDSGSCVGKRYEKDDTLSFSLSLKNELENLGFQVHLSRDTDEDVDRIERGQMANESGAQLFISIHRNKADEGNGVEIYIPSSNSSETQLLGKNIMQALVSQGFAERNIKAGTLISSNEDYYENSVPTMPSCLVEIGFMQSKKDNELFDNHQKDIVKSLAAAIESTFQQLYEQAETEQ